MTQTVSTKKEGNQRAFLAAFAECGSVSHSARAARVSRRQHYRWVKEPEYQKAFLKAQRAAASVLEDEAVRRAVRGTREPIMYQGKEVGHKIVYSDVLLIFLLKGDLPEKYRDRYEVKNVDPPEVYDPGREKLSDADLDALIEYARQQKAVELRGEADANG